MNLHRCEPNLFLLLLCLAAHVLLVVPLLLGRLVVGGE